MSNEELSNADDDENKSNDETTDKKGAGVKFPPPLIFVLLIIVGLALDYIWPLEMSIPGSAGVFGIVLMLFAVAVAGLINATFKRAGTAIEPWKPTSNIVTTGFYAWSRNPIYTGFCVFNIGLGISLNNLWVFLSFIPGAVLVYFIAIVREEAYLEEKFGEEYLAYKRKVRRWI